MCKKLGDYSVTPNKIKEYNSMKIKDFISKYHMDFYKAKKIFWERKRTPSDMEVRREAILNKYWIEELRKECKETSMDWVAKKYWIPRHWIRFQVMGYAYPKKKTYERKRFQENTKTPERVRQCNGINLYY